MFVHNNPDTVEEQHRLGWYFEAFLYKPKEAEPLVKENIDTNVSDTH